MSDYQRKISTVLGAIASFIDYHDKEDYEEGFHHRSAKK